MINRDVTAVIVHYGALSPTIRTAKSCEDWAAAVMVVANDGSSIPKELEGRVLWITPPSNLGYGGAANDAIALARTPFVAILNNDILLENVCASRCLDALRIEDSVAIVGPMLLNSEGKPSSAFGSISRFLKRTKMRFEDSSNSGDCEWVTGAVMFARVDALRQHPFRTRYFLGYEDAELCWRLGQEGWRIVCRSDVFAFHEGGTVIGSARWYYFAARNRIWVSEDIGGPALRRAWLTITCLQFLRVYLADVVKCRGFQRSRLMLKGISHSRDRSWSTHLPDD
jgi:N-acetylglucosaminyl-diphospho-decaprenol L-rhamnosyltransferase